MADETIDAAAEMPPVAGKVRPKVRRAAKSKPAKAPKARTPKPKGRTSARSNGTPAPSEPLTGIVPDRGISMKDFRSKSRPQTKAAPRGPSAAVKDAAVTLKQVSDPVRLLILLTLADTPLNVGQICRAVNVQSQPAVSHHIALMRHGRLVQPERDGRHNIYSLTDDGRKLAQAVRGLVV